MLNFTSSLYLDMKHSSTELLGWQQLTTGVPAALNECLESRQISQQVAKMQGLETGISAPSTLHLYWDLFGFLANQQIIVFIDEKIYPVSKYGIERLITKGVPVYYFRHLDANHLYELLQTKIKEFKIPVVFTDGWCPECGKNAPIKVYLEILKAFRGNIIIDDTQAFGIFGERKTNFFYGDNGGGILKWLDVFDNNIISITSLAKAFGAPMAVMSGNTEFITSFKDNSDTRVTSSPVSIAHLNAGLNALRINGTEGDRRRKKLENNVVAIRGALMTSGINVTGSIFPVQSLTFSGSDYVNLFYAKLNNQGIRTVLAHGHLPSETLLSFIIRSNHNEEELEKLLHSIKSLFEN
jgi:8-amino-7-oxononanoate synthase